MKLQKGMAKLRFGRYATVCLIAALASTPGVAFAEETLAQEMTSSHECVAEALEADIALGVDESTLADTPETVDTQGDAASTVEAGEMEGGELVSSAPAMVENSSNMPRGALSDASQVASEADTMLVIAEDQQGEGILKAGEQSTEEQLADGMYVIRSLNAERQVVDIEEAASDGKLITWASNSGQNQRFVIQRVESDLYSIVSALDGRGVDSNGEKGDRIGCSDEAGLWRIKHKDNGWTIGAADSGLLLDVDHAQKANRTKLVLWTEKATDYLNQLWEFVLAPVVEASEETPEPGFYRLAGESGKLMDVSHCVDAEGTTVGTWVNNGGANQLFRVEVTDNGFVRLHAGDTDRVVNSGSDVIFGAGTATLDEVNDTCLNQFFRTERLEDGSWVFRDVATGAVLVGTSSTVTSAEEGSWRLEEAGDMLKEGLVALATVAAPGSRVDVSNSSVNAGARILQWAYNGGQNQKWDLIKVGENTYQLQAVRSGHYLAFDESGKAILSDEGASFRVVPLVNGWGFVDTATGKALDIYGGNANNGSAVQSWEYIKSNAQRFQVMTTVPLTSGLYAIDLRDRAGHVVSVATQTADNGANIQLTQWAGNEAHRAGNQKWYFTRNDDGTYTIENAYSHLAIDASGDNPQPGANVVQWSSKHSDNQKWNLVYNHDGSFTIVNVANPDVVLTAATESVDANVTVSDQTGELTHFAFEPVSWRTRLYSGNAVLDNIITDMINRFGTGEQGLWNAYVAIGNIRYTGMNIYPQGSWPQWSIPYAVEMYQRGAGNCYRYASLMCWFARGLGYEARTVSGEVFYGSGIWNPHGWTEVDLNGQKLVIDARQGVYRANRGEKRLEDFYMVSYEKYPFYIRIVNYD